MPFGFVIYAIAPIIADWQQDKLDEERAAGEGMFERHVELEGIWIPRMLSWAEVRALRQDLREARI